MMSVAAAPRARSACTATSAARPTPRTWPAPLDRRVSLRPQDITLRDAIDGVAAAGRFRISYSAELVPLARRVCASFESAPAGDVLAELLEGTSIAPVVAGPDQVVLAPVRQSAEPRARLSQRPAAMLDRVVVTGNVATPAEGGLPVAFDVLQRDDLTARDASTLADMLDGAVPGVWVWQQSPSSLLARYGSIRGASSFGVTSPKIYIDGIEVANPLLLTQFSPDAIDRVEVVRGPQGGALYGADAISGVINIVPRHDDGEAAGQRIQLRSDFGIARSDFASLGVLAQDHAVAIRGGSGGRSGGIGFSLGSIGEYAPGAFSRQLSATGDVRLIGGRTSLTAFARLFGQQAGAAESPLLVRTIPSSSPYVHRRSGNGAGRDGTVRDETVQVVPTFGSVDPQSVREYTVGATGTLASSSRWTHQATLGMDGYHLSNVALRGALLTSPADSALRAARGGADRATFRVSSVAELGTRDDVAATVRITAEHSVMREETAADVIAGTVASGATVRGGDLPAKGTAYTTTRVLDTPSVDWLNTTGLAGQASVALRNTLFFNGGLRLDRSGGYTASSQLAALPALGAAYVTNAGGATLKLRMSYGKAIRPARASVRELSWSGLAEIAAPADLGPEVQSGVEAGADLTFGHRLSLHLTRFDQRASGLIQAVATSDVSRPVSGPGPRTVDYELQTVGEISNRGWEMQGTAHAGALSLTGALSLVDSRVQRVTPGYTGDLLAGDRMLEVPAQTVSVTAAWRAARWSSALSVARASDWVNYDRLAVARDLALGIRLPSELVGTPLRAYWRDYPGVTRLRLTASRDLVHGIALTFTGDNLLNYQRGEPDDVTILPGRTISFGLRAKF
jgi:outer membrane cobalamin receptor